MLKKSYKKVFPVSGMYYICTIKPTKNNNHMKTYITLIALAIFSFYGALRMNIPTDNQIAMALLGCFCIGALFILSIVDIKHLIEKKAIERYKKENQC